MPHPLILITFDDLEVLRRNDLGFRCRVVGRMVSIGCLQPQQRSDLEIGGGPLELAHVENGEPIPDRPPLFHWISASVAWLRTTIATRSIPTRTAVSRGFDEWTLRFPSAICGVLMVMAIAVPGRRIVGERAALLAAAT